MKRDIFLYITLVVIIATSLLGPSVLREIQPSVFAYTSPTHSNQINKADASASTKITLIHFDPYISIQERDERIAEMNGELVNWMAPIGVATVRLTLPDGDINGLADVVGVDGHEVQSVEFDGEVRGTFVADDPDLTDPKKVYIADMLNLFAAWDYTTGSKEVIIAVLDTGVFLDHPEFTGHLTEGYDFVNADDDPSDDHGRRCLVGCGQWSHLCRRQRCRYRRTKPR